MVIVLSPKLEGMQQVFVAALVNFNLSTATDAQGFVMGSTHGRNVGLEFPGQQSLQSVELTLKSFAVAGPVRFRGNKRPIRLPAEMC